MNPPAPQTRGFCPGVWSPMEAGDGWILRIRPPRARLSSAQLLGLSALAARTGNGIIELTRRANLQIRGVLSAELASARERLQELELAPESAEQERRPQLLVSALSGLDARCPPLEPLADELGAVLSKNAAALRLPAKFWVLLSGGDGASAALAADVHVRLHPAQQGLAELWLGGEHLGACRSGEAATLFERVLEVLAAECASAAWAALRRGALAGVAARVRPLLAAAAPAPSWPCPGLGIHAGREPWLSLEVPFGSAPSEVWVELAELARTRGRAEIRFGARREVLLPALDDRASPSVRALVQQHGLRVEQVPGELELVACSGAPACRSAHTETRQLARELGALTGKSWPRGSALHVSGCVKGCASNDAATFSIVAASDGYHLGLNQTIAEAALEPSVSLAELRARVGSAPVPARQLALPRSAAPGHWS